jgi:transaldolase
VARDLEREGIPVNFTSTFSARQVVAAALPCDVSRTNIFLGRLDQGLEACLLGAQVSLEAQRALRRLRHTLGVKTLLIVASIRNWDTFVQTAGCDVYTAPVNVLRDWMKQDQIAPERDIRPGPIAGRNRTDRETVRCRTIFYRLPGVIRIDSGMAGAQRCRNAVQML